MGTAFEKALQLDDARKARTHEEVLRHDPQSLERDPALLRAPLYERHSGRDEQHHTKHQASRPRAQE